MADAQGRTVGNLNKWLPTFSEEKQEDMLGHLLAKAGQKCDVKYVQEIGTFRGHVYVSVLCTNNAAFMFKTTTVPIGVWPCVYFEELSRGRIKCFQPLPEDERNSC
jgi:hypothetical protein